MKLVAWSAVVAVVREPAGLDIQRVGPVRFRQVAEDHGESTPRQTPSSRSSKSALVSYRKELREGIGS
jgi:hypothetical protein